MNLSINEVCELGTVLLFSRFWFWKFPSGPKRYLALRETGPCSRSRLLTKVLPRASSFLGKFPCKLGWKKIIRGDLTRGFEFLKYQVKRVTSCELLEEKQFFLTILNRLQFLSFEPCLKISLIVILLSYSHEHNICIKFIFATMYINFIILFTCWCQKCGITFLLILSFLRNSCNLGRSDFSFLRR